MNILKKVCFFLFLALANNLICQSSSVFKDAKDIVEKYEANFNILADPNEGGRNRQISQSTIKSLFVSNESRQFDFLQYKEDETNGSMKSGYSTTIGRFASFLVSRKYEGSRISINQEDIRLIYPGNNLEEQSQIEVRFIQEAYPVVNDKRLSKATNSISVFLVQSTDRYGIIEYKIEEIIQLENDLDYDTFINNTLEDECPQNAGSAKGCPDRDKDGIPDKDDLCPDIAASGSISGCPDDDNDGVENADDACPKVPGKRLNRGDANYVTCNGCPDADGDRICGISDECPNDAGVSPSGCPDDDKDGFHNKIDNCPSQYGSRSSFRSDCNGCPDTDRDGLCDKFDNCPNDSGPPELGGCPDRDRDLVPDDQDRCPDTFGIRMNKKEPNFYRCNGCPDDDKDGICNSFDKCPNTPYGKGNGCPPEDPIGKIYLKLLGGYAIPLGDFGSNELYDKSTIGFNEGVGLAQSSFGGSFTVGFQPSIWLGAQLQGGFQQFGFNRNALQSNLQLFFLANNIETNSILINSSNEPYNFMYGMFNLRLGYFKTGTRFTLALMPGIGIMTNKTGSELQEIKGIINYGGINPSFDTFTLTYGNEEEPSSRLINVGFEIGYRPFYESNLFISLEGQFSSSQVNYSQQSIEFLNNSTGKQLVLNEQLIRWASLNLGLTYYFK